MPSTSNQRLFRKTALERLSSPEQLDQLVVISDPMGWLALTTLLVLLALIVAWGFLGRIPEQVDGKGILISQGGKVMAAMSPSAGEISRLLVAQDASVRKGQPLAIIEQTALSQHYREQQQVLKDREAAKAETVADFDQENPLREENFSEQIDEQHQIIAAATQRAEYLKDALVQREGLAKSGVLPLDKLEATRADYNRTLQDIAAARVRILEIHAQTMRFQSRHKSDMRRIDQSIEAARRQVANLATQLQQDSRVLAPVAGRVTELDVFPGEIVASGVPVANIATTGNAQQAIIYVPTADGKRVTRGMTVRVAPSTVKKEVHGTIIGTVTRVSEFPATEQGMMAVLQNQRLVSAYSRQGAPYAARVELEADPHTVSGLKWTSGAGPAIRITAGTTVAAQITVAQKPPVDLIIPFVRKHTGIGFLNLPSMR